MSEGTPLKLLVVGTLVGTLVTGVIFFHHPLGALTRHAFNFATDGYRGTKNTAEVSRGVSAPEEVVKTENTKDASVFATLKADRAATAADARSCVKGEKILCYSPANTCGMKNTAQVICGEECSVPALADSVCPNEKVSDNATRELPLPTLYATPTIIVRGQSCSLLWDKDDGDTCTLEGEGIDQLIGEHDTTGVAHSPALTSTASYLLSCASGKIAQATCHVVRKSYKSP